MLNANIEHIGPREAIALLAHNHQNRPLSAHAVRRYAKAMKEGQWRLNGEGIQIADDGTLLNGQHRLQAIVSSGVTVPILLVRGVARDTFSTFDDGKKRNGTDVLSLRGEKNAAVLLTSARTILLMTRGSTVFNMVTNSDVLATVDAYPEVRTWVNKYANTAKIKNVFPNYLPGVLTLASSRYGFEVVESFFNKLASGENLSATDPAFQLREKFMTAPKGLRMSQEMKIAYCVKAINAHIQGKPMKILRHQEREALPELV